MNKENRTKIIKSILLFIAVIIFGISGYVMIEGWNLIDSVYMTVITLTTIGYGETNQLTNNGRIFTIILIILGLGSAASVLNSFASIILDMKLNNFLGRRAMNLELKKMKNHVILCGFGQLGSIIALKLQEKSIPFVVIDANDEEIERASHLGFVFVQGQSTDDATLLNAGIKRAGIIVICIQDIMVNLTLSLAAKELNSDIKVIAQGGDRSLESRITRAGADIVISPLALGGEQISEIIAGNYAHEENVNMSSQQVDGYYIRMYHHFSEEALTIREVLLNGKGLRAIAYKPKLGELMDNPPVDTKVYKDDSIIVLFNNNIETLEIDKKNIIQTKIEWSDDYSVGVSSLDEEHLRLINLINTLTDAIDKKVSKDILEDIFDKLIHYSLEHFSNEEQLMRKFNYPELDQHILEHKKLMKVVMDLNKEKNYIFPSNVREFLNLWLIDHILNSDKKYVLLLSQNNKD